MDSGLIVLAGDIWKYRVSPVVIVNNNDNYTGGILCVGLTYLQCLWENG